MKKLLMLSIVLMSTTTYAQDLGIQEASDSVWQQVSGAAPVILTIIFMVGGLLNIGKLMGEDRDYKSFLKGVGLFFVGAIILGSIVTFLLSLNF